VSRPGPRLPVVEHGQAERLALRVVAQVGLEAERLQHRQERLDQEDGRPGLGHVRRHVPAPLAEHRVDGADAVCAAPRPPASGWVGAPLPRSGARRSAGVGPEKGRKKERSHAYGQGCDPRHVGSLPPAPQHTCVTLTTFGTL